MDSGSGAKTFATTGAAYDGFMGRYSEPLAVIFADTLQLTQGLQALDIGCGPGALTHVLAERLGSDAVSACDPSAPFVQSCTDRCPGVDVRAGRAEDLPFADEAFDIAVAQLVLHVVADAPRAASEMRRILRTNGRAAASGWEFSEGMQMLGHFWEAARSVDPMVPDEATSLRFGGPGEIADLFEGVGFRDVAETTLTVTSEYAHFDDLWSGFLAGIGPAGAYCMNLSRQARTAVREELFSRVGSPTGAFALTAMARCASGLKPA